MARRAHRRFIGRNCPHGKRPISEQFRPAPRTCLKVCGRLACGQSTNWAVVLEDGPCRLLKIIGRWLIGLHSSPLGALPPASHKRYSRLGWSIWRSLLGSVNRQQCGKIPLASEICWPAGSVGWRYVAAGGSPRGRDDRPMQVFPNSAGTPPTEPPLPSPPAQCYPLRNSTVISGT